MQYYTCEVYYYFASVILFLFGKIATLLKTEFLYGISFVWVFQILFNLILSSIILEIFNKPKNIISKIAYIVPFVLVFSKLYYNSVLGFFGNSFYTLILSYVSYFIIEYLTSKDENLLKILLICTYSICSFTSSGIYTLYFIILGLFFFSKEVKKFPIWTSCLAVIPFSNAMYMERYSFLMIYIFPLIFGIIIYFAEKLLYSFIKSRRYIYILLSLLFIITFALSRKFSAGLFDFNGLFQNLSQNSDMTLNYFDYSDTNLLIVIYKVFVMLVLSLSLLLGYKNNYIKFIWVLIIVIFNPFSCNFFNHYVNVYYRAYDIFINPVSISFLLTMCITKINNTSIQTLVSTAICLLFIVSFNPIKPIYYHEKFIPDTKYNEFYKMNEDQIDIIRELKANMLYYGEDEPYIITDNLLTLSSITQGKYILGRERAIKNSWTVSEKKLFEIFTPPDYFGHYIVDNPDYDNLMKYINDAKIDYIVINKKYECFDKDINKFILFEYMIYNKCNVNPIYENELYAIYHF